MFLEPGGAMIVTSDRGQDASFRVYWPVVTGEAQ